MKGLLLASLGQIVLRASPGDAVNLTASAYNSMDIGRLFWSYLHTTGCLCQRHVVEPLSQDQLSSLMRGQHGGAKGFAKDFGEELTTATVWNTFLSQLREAAKPATPCPSAEEGAQVVTWPFLAVALCEHRQCLQRSEINNK